MAITKTGKILIKEAVTRWKDFIQNMSKYDRDRITTGHIANPINSYINGINKGTINILKRYGYTRGNIDGVTPSQANLAKAKTTGYIKNALQQNDTPGVEIGMSTKLFQDTNPKFGENIAPIYDNPRAWNRMSTDRKGKIVYTKGAYMPKTIMSNDGKMLFNAISNRHEAYEAMAIDNGIRDYLKNVEKGDKNILTASRQYFPHLRNISDEEILARIDNLKIKGGLSIRTPGRFETSKGKRAVDHENIKVLMQERKLLDTFPYKENDGYEIFRKMRNEEYKYMDHAGEYDGASFDRYNERNFRKMTSKMKRKIPVPMGNGETWTPLY